MLQVKTCLIFIFALVFSTANAQHFPEDISHWLSKAEKDKLIKSESLIDQGKLILFAHLLKRESDSLSKKQLTYIDLSENIYLGKRTSRQLYETKDYFSSGFRLRQEVYRGYIEYYLNNEDNHFNNKVSVLNDSIVAKVELAKGLRSKSLISGNIIKTGKYIHQANIYDQEAILLCEEALNLISKGEVFVNTIVEDEKVKEAEINRKDSAVPFTRLVEEPVAKPVIGHEKQEIAKSASKVNTEEVEKDESKIEVYYTVQILADKKPVSRDRIEKVYDGQYKIIENIGDGWYRYSFGKFTKLSEAKKALTESGTKGYVVAYKNNTRISLSEAKKYLLNQNHRK